MTATQKKVNENHSQKNEKEQVRVIPLGGLDGIGRNMTLLEYKGKILIIDIGIGFPDENMPGIDCTIPNTAYLKGKEKNIVGAVFTHGHYDHIAAIPYILPRIGSIPMYAGALTKEMILQRQKEFPNQPEIKIQKVEDGSIENIGPFTVEFFRINHSIPNNLGVIIKSPVGNILHTSDFKFDEAPVNGSPTNFKKLKEMSQRGISLLMSDSTGAEEEGHSLSETTIFNNLDEIFKKSRGRIIVASFSSLINRIQQIITLSEKHGRKVAIEGRSMQNNVEICQNMKSIKIKKGTIINASDIAKYPENKITVLCTGAQGEERAIFMKIVNKEHRFISIKPRDAVVFSSSVIPGNERSIQELKDQFYRQGAKVYHYKMMDIHASGHAKKEELAKMIEIMKPKFFMPVHGHYSMRVKHSEIAQEKGILEKNIIVAGDGQVLILEKGKFYASKKEVPAERVLVDGLGVGDVGEVVLRDRQMLAKDGMFVIVAAVDRKTGKVASSPDIISRGFVYLRESQELLRETRRRVRGIVNGAISRGGAVNWGNVKEEIKSKIGDYLFHKTRRRPIVLPVIVEV